MVYAAVAVVVVLGLSGIGGAFGSQTDDGGGSSVQPTAGDPQCTDGDNSGCYDGDGDGTAEAWCPALETCNVGVTVPSESTEGTDVPMGDGEPTDTAPAPNVQTTAIPQPSTSVPGCATATAASGESWSVLAERYGVRLSEILAMNGLPPDTVSLMVGQVYCHPDGDGGATTSSSTTTTSQPATTKPSGGGSRTPTGGSATTSTTTTTAPKQSPTAGTNPTTTAPPVPTTKAAPCANKYIPDVGESWGDIGAIFGISGADVRSFNSGGINPVPYRVICIPGHDGLERI